MENASAPRPATAAIMREPCHVRMRRHASAGSATHASSNGSTTSPPAVSPSHHVRQKCASSDSPITPPANIDAVPTVALIAVAIPSANSMPTTCSTPVESGATADQPTQQQCSDDALGHIAGLLADQTSERKRRVVDEQLSNDTEPTEKDPGPPAESPEVKAPRCRARPAARLRPPKLCSGGSGRSSER